MLVKVKSNQTTYIRPKTERLHSGTLRAPTEVLYYQGKQTSKSKVRTQSSSKSQEQSAIQKIIRSITQKNNYTSHTYQTTNSQPTMNTIVYASPVYRSPKTNSKVNRSSRGNSPTLHSINNSKVLKQRCVSQASLNRSPPQISKTKSPESRGVLKNIENIALRQYFSVRAEKKCDQFNYLAILGQGKFGKVYLAQHKTTRQIFAMKTIKKCQLSETNLQHQFQREVSIQRSLRHRNILRLFDVFEDENLYYLQMEHAKEGSLFQYIVKQPQKYVGEREAAQIVQQVVRAVKYMHHNDVIHRDLKPENILLCENNVIKVSDFGWSVKLEKKERDTLCGTLEYLSPEMINRETYDFSIDIWSIGVLIYEICTGKTPFANPTSCDLTELNFPSHLSYQVCDIIRHLLVNRKSRKGLDWILRHKWFNNVQ